jgi:beta-mannosidase
VSGVLPLNGTWGLTYAEGDIQVNPDRYTGAALEGRRLLRAPVPAPIHRVLMDAGWIEDIYVGLNSLKARWVEEAFWVYRHTFEAPAEAGAAACWLVFDRLEYEAVVWLNGAEVGRHANAHRPARFRVSGALRSGENLLVVQVGTGMHGAADKPVIRYGAEGMDRLTRRIWQRKPEYQCGWDWNPRLMNVGILGDVRLEWTDGPRLDQVSAFAVPAEDLSRARVTARATVEEVSDEPREATLRVRVAEAGQEIAVPCRIAPGEQRLEASLEIAGPRLWWPRGWGEPFRYTVEVSLTAGGETQAVTRRLGIRHVALDQAPHPDGGRFFRLVVNGAPIFCRGANWVPPDLLYSEVTAARTRRLVRDALDAGFTLLRVWGGGTYADAALCEACDEAGLLLWHDFAFAWGRYPGDDPEWLAEVRREITHAVRERAHVAALVVWCGNNEIAWGDDWDGRGPAPDVPHRALFETTIPEIVAAEDPSKAHWPSSPWSPDGLPPNDPAAGDQHPWDVSLMRAGGADWWLYRERADRFADEGGVLGASPPATLRRFLPDGDRSLLSPSWDHHDNAAALTDTVPGALGHAYQTVRLWLGRDPLAMRWEEYAFASALLQAEGLSEYVANYRRRQWPCAGAVFWMFNDSWPTTHGWAVVDYYGRRKLAFHPVRRAMAPITIVVARGAHDLAMTVVYGVNNTPEDWAGTLHCGRFAVRGGPLTSRRLGVTLPANTSAPLADIAGSDPRTDGCFAVLERDGRAVAQHRLLHTRFHGLGLTKPDIRLTLEGGALSLLSDAFAWGVCLDVDGDLPLADNCFDLLPGLPYTLPWGDGLGEPRVARVGNDLTLPEETP